MLATFQQFHQIGDLNTYISNFRKLKLELGKLVTDEATLWQFIGGLKHNIRREVLKDAHLTTLSDAILIAERVDAAEQFAEVGFRTYSNKNK